MVLKIYSIQKENNNGRKKYFKHFPTIDFDVKNDGNLIEAKDIFRNIRVSDDADDAITGYEYYYVGDQDRPDVLASKLYGDATLYWLFWMVNDQFATYNDWIQISVGIREIYCKEIFWKSIGIYHSSRISYPVRRRTTNFSPWEKVVGSTSSAFGFVTKIDPTNKQIVLNDIQGQFQVGETVTVVQEFYY